MCLPGPRYPERVDLVRLDSTPEIATFVVFDINQAELDLTNSDGRVHRTLYLATCAVVGCTHFEKTTSTLLECSARAFLVLYTFRKLAAWLATKPGILGPKTKGCMQVWHLNCGSSISLLCFVGDRVATFGTSGCKEPLKHRINGLLS